jgi:deoxyadenosine/deoxycytidine kinase
MADRPLPPPIKGRVTVVGVCAAGKTELVARLRARGYDARHCIQEHSQVADMWQRISRPEVLVYLDASLETIRRRRPDDDYDEAYIQEQRRRLAHARQHCQVYISTDALSVEEVFERVVAALEGLGVKPG